MNSVFEQMKEEMVSQGISPRTDASRKWFLAKVDNISSVDRNKLLRQPPAKGATDIVPGQMYMFWYDPKTKASLPYYDRFPLIFPIDIKRDGMTGINLHYLPLGVREKFFYKLLNTVSDTRYDDRTHLKMTYDFLKGTASLRPFKPCFKRYLASQVNGRIVNIPSSEWETAMYLPTAVFDKKTESAVHRDSRRIIGGR